MSEGNSRSPYADACRELWLAAIAYADDWSTVVQRPPEAWAPPHAAKRLKEAAVAYASAEMEHNDEQQLRGDQWPGVMLK